MLNEREIIKIVLAQYRLPLDGPHGVGHWARVYENGLLLARHAGLAAGQKEVVKLFAILHDACRLNDEHDPEHGRRGHLLMQRIEETTDLFSDLTVSQLAACLLAVQDHADGRLANEYPPGPIDRHPEIQVSWDADRLDLDRVGIKPDPKLLGVKQAALINECRLRAKFNAIPRRVFNDWGFELTSPFQKPVDRKTSEPLKSRSGESS